MIKKTCENCKHHGHKAFCFGCHWTDKWEPIEIISFQRLNGLIPTLNSCTAKVYEEIGELMQLLGKGQRASGEQTYSTQTAQSGHTK